MSVLDRPLVFIDIETNGLSSARGKVIEIAALRVENKQVAEEFRTFLDPGGPLPEYITTLTGIRDSDVNEAPLFIDKIQELRHILRDDAVFVAHNVRFDYSFIKQEFVRIGQEFDPTLLCTVRLSRALHPGVKGHSLQKLIDRHNLRYDARHRAYDDAHAIFEFFCLMHEQFGLEAVEIACQKQLKLQALPSNIPHELVDDLPSGPGVYIFEDEQRKPIYVGKSVSIRKRVLSHFTDDYKVAKELKISQHIRHISFEETAGELEALLLESRLVKELQPLYNVKLRRLSKLTLLVAEPDEKGYLHVRIREAGDIAPEDFAKVLGVFSGRSKAKSNLEATRKLFDICPKLLGLEKSSGACFYRQLGKCSGACEALEPAERHNERLHMAFRTLRVQAWPYKGPILIEEQSAQSERSSGVVVDQWCIVAQLSQAAASDDVVVKPFQKTFDLDTYKILRSFLAEKRAGLQIKLLEYTQIQQLLAMA